VSLKDLNTTGIIFLRANSHEIMSIATLLVTLPGTNTAEAMYLNVPMFVVAPLNKPELIILDGIAGLIEKAPLVGPLIKKMAIQALRKKIKFVSLPNRIANKRIVPEIIDTVESKALAIRIMQLLSDKVQLDTMRNDLKNIKKDTHVALKMYHILTSNL
jgi:lipid A disaccharide synthetase